MDDKELTERMASAALTSFEWSCDWGRAAEAAKDEALDFGVKPRKSHILHAVNLAQMQWGELTLETKNRKGETQHG